MSNTNDRKLWWFKRRFVYNKGLIIVGIIAFLLYVVLGELLIEPYDNNFEVTLLTTGFQGVVYLIMMVIANVFYNLGYILDRWLNKQNSEIFRVNLYNLGYWFSVLLPFIIPLIIVIQYFTIYRK